MDNDAPETVTVHEAKVACDGGVGALGHPKVYLTLGSDGVAECPYCDRRFVLAPGPNPSGAHPSGGDHQAATASAGGVRVLSVNVGMPADLVDRRGRVLKSGIAKMPVEGPVHISNSGLEGDGQADPVAHGGPHRAVYAYPAAHYRFWTEEEGRDDLAFGTLGENLTFEGDDERSMMVGDRFRVGTAHLEVTYARIPCVKLGIRLGDPTFPDRFLASRRTGFFFRVLEEGEVSAGDEAVQTAHGPGRFTVREALELLYGPDPDRERLSELGKVEAMPEQWRERAQRIAQGERV